MIVGPEFYFIVLWISCGSGVLSRPGNSENQRAVNWYREGKYPSQRLARNIGMDVSISKHLLVLIFIQEKKLVHNRGLRLNVAMKLYWRLKSRV